MQRCSSKSQLMTSSYHPLCPPLSSFSWKTSLPSSVHHSLCHICLFSFSLHRGSNTSSSTPSSMSSTDTLAGYHSVKLKCLIRTLLWPLFIDSSRYNFCPDFSVNRKQSTGNPCSCCSKHRGQPASSHTCHTETHRL